MGKKRNSSSNRQLQLEINGSGANGIDTDHVQFVSISDETRRRYLNYALSVITSRALPDVRDGLKPVQRRILYVMYEQLRLTADQKTRKCAKIVGDTTGNFHPHGNTAVYDALVRLAQDFSLRYPVVEGQGNFGSVMGLPPAAERYTEARVTRIAEQLMNELRFDTVDMRPNYDASAHEPVVLPARYPNLLVNGIQGIAVGMATNVPPHNLGEVIKACIHLIHNPDATVAQLMRFVKGPDFPLGGRIVSDRAQIRKAYEEGRGSVKVRGEWRFDKQGRREIDTRIVVYSIPYGVTTNPLMTEIGDLIASRKLPQLIAANDETNDESGLRIVFEIKPGADPNAVMAYLYKHTNLEQNFSFNLTCLTPDERGTLVPRLLALNEILRPFLDFRYATIVRRLGFQLRQLERRIHVLEGFAVIFNDLEKALQLIRRSQGRQDAATKLMKNYPLDEVQALAVVDLQLYRISRLEINKIREELDAKRKEADRIRRLLNSDKRLWGMVEAELQEVADEFADKRRTAIGSSEEITEFDPQAYIVRENTNVVISREGWIKRVGRLAKVESTRIREGDSVLDVIPGSTLDHCVFFSSEGVAYTLPITDIPASSGYGEPLSKHVRMGDGAQIVASITTDVRFTPPDSMGEAPAPYLLILTARGQVMYLPLSQFRTPSTKVGRKFCRLRKGDRVMSVELAWDAETMFIATRKARVLHFRVDEIPVLQNAGTGVRGIKLAEDDEVLGAVQLGRPSDCLRVKLTNDKTASFGQTKYSVTSRGGKGVQTSVRNEFAEIIRPPIELVDWAEMDE